MRKICIAIIVAVLLFTACQATPEEPIVVGKNNDILAEVIEMQPTTEIPIEVPTHQKHETALQNATETLTVNVDAAVNITGNGAPVSARVAPHDFTQDEAQKYADVLFDGQPMYSGDALIDNADRLQIIDELQEQLLTEQDSENREQIMQSIAKFESALGETSLDEMPVEFTQKEWGEIIYLASDGSDGLYRRFIVSNRTHDYDNSLLYTAGKTGYYGSNTGTNYNLWNTAISGDLKRGEEEYGNPDALNDPELSADEAIGLAQNMLEEMGILDYAHQQTNVLFGQIDGAVQKAYELHFTRSIEGSEFTYTSYSEVGLTEDGQGDFFPSWNAESVTFIVTDYVVSMELNNPYDVSEILSTSTEILSFEEIMDIFDKMIVVTRAYSNNDRHRQIDINRINLGLMRVLEPGTGNGLAIPVWDFFGTITVEGNISSDDQTSPFLTINAVDGSIIDRGLGY